MLRLILCILACAMFSHHATARECTTNIKGKAVKLSYSEVEYFKQKTSLRDLAASRAQNLCPGYVILRHLTPKLSDTEREVFCLNHDAERGYYRGVSEGPRDAYGVCSKPGKVCEFVKEQKDAALALSSAVAGVTAGASATSAAGITAVMHSSGAYILTGGAGYIAGTLGTVGATALSVLTAPLVVTGAAVSVVGVGGAIYLCQ